MFDELTKIFNLISLATLATGCNSNYYNQSLEYPETKAESPIPAYEEPKEFTLEEKTLSPQSIS